MIRPLALLILVLAAGCAPPPYDVEHNIGMVKDSLFEDAAAVLSREGIAYRQGQGVSGLTGIRVAHEDAFLATRILLQWRRGKEPGAFLTREEFQMSLEGR
jgi:hypothetical protein